MATSPGRSAIQAKPKATPTSATKKRMILIIPTSLPTKCVRSIARKLASCRERSLPCLSFGDPSLCRCPRCCIELAEIDECVVDGRACRFFLDARQYVGSIVTCRRINGAYPYELGGTRLKTFQVTTSWRLPARSLHYSRHQRAQLLGKNCDGRYAARRV